MNPRVDRKRIEDSLNHIDALRRHLARGDLADEAIMDAVCMRLSAAIDALSHGEPSLGQRLFPSSWRQMRGTRNDIAHGCLTIDFAVISDTVKYNLPEVECDALSWTARGRRLALLPLRWSLVRKVTRRI